MLWRTIVIGAALLAALIPIPASIIERVYSAGVFPPLQRVLTSTSNLTGVALFDVFIVLALGGWIGLLVRDWRRIRPQGWARLAVRVVVRTVTLVAACYVAFLVLWGWNYQRRSLIEKLAFDTKRVTPEAALELAGRSVLQLNALYKKAHEEGWTAPGVLDGPLSEAFWRTQQDLGSRSRIVPGRPKQTLFDWYFQRAGVAGMTDPYFLETLVASDLLPFERPQVVAHEWAHLAGFADEGDANFVGWLSCVRGTVPHQYSGWLFLYGEVVRALDRSNQRAVAVTLDQGPRGDLQAIRDRMLRNVNQQVSVVGWRVYDSYLKANHIESGARSYGEVVTLILGTPFEADGRPALR